MEEEIKILDILSEKTRKDIKIFVANCSISDDPVRKSKFYDLIQRVIVESSIGSKDKIKSK
jgi:hypothetical protein